VKVFTSEGSHPIKAWVDHVPPIEEAAMEQLRNVARMPFIHRHVAVMPDVHHGKGATVGSVIATKGAVIPAACGVDLGCGCTAVQLSLKASQLPDNLFAIRSAIEAAVPHGRTANGGPGDKGAWSDVPDEVGRAWADMLPGFERIIDRHPKVEKCNNFNHLGTLGGGNHFYSLAVDQNQDVWVMLHSGSRGLGNRIGSHFIELAKQDMKKWFINLPDQDLAYLVQGSDHFEDYCQAVRFAQNYASVNREIMMQRGLSALKQSLPGIEFTTKEQVISCHHNYISWERHFGDDVIVTRKGALSAKEGELSLIPASMGRTSYVVRGKGNRESFHSCSHGAGRLMSRTEAKKRFTVEDHIKATEGVECRKDADVIDETPACYKDIDSVLQSQEDLVEVLFGLKEILVIKG
jgi:tRNA-splicing ligase RtcB (3'-phosphate/5'-hydroxy nucleic acid ligase)